MPNPTLTVEDLLYRIEKLEARVAELQTTICSGLKVVVDPNVDLKKGK